MKSFLRNVRIELLLTIKSPFVYFSAGILFIVSWLQILELSDASTGVFALTVLLESNTSILSHAAAVSSINLILNFCSSYWYDLFLVAAAAVCYSIPLCDERTSGMLRFSMPRCGKRTYIIGKLTAGAIAAIYSVVLGYTAFALSAGIFAPSIYSFSPEEISDFLSAYTYGDSMSSLVIFKMLMTSLKSLFYCIYNITFWSLTAMAIVSIKPNKYYAVTLPAVLYCFWYKLIYGDFAALRDWMRLVAPQIFGFSDLDILSGASGLAVALLQIAVMLLRLVVPIALFWMFTESRLDTGAQS